MFSPLRNRFGVPGVISVIALVFAMLGGAYAASSSDNGKATASAKAKKGPRGPKGATGPAGPAGAQGPAGANGKDGANGSNGSNGSPGAPGKSVVIGNTAPGCAEGGKSVEVEGAPATKKEICNGLEGPQGNNGNNGSPWTAGGTLPVGSTETGNWILGPESQKFIFNSYHGAAISFPVPLAANHPAVTDETGAHYIYLESAETSANCDDGSAGNGAPGPNNPEAASGYLCVFAGDLSETGDLSLLPPGTLAPGVTGRSGGFLYTAASVNDERDGFYGSFAVTG